MIDVLEVVVSPVVELLALEMLLDRLPERPGAFFPSFLSLERGALLPLLPVSLAGTTVICCIGMLLFPGNAPVLLPQHSQHAASLNHVPACDPLSHL